MNFKLGGHIVRKAEPKKKESDLTHSPEGRTKEEGK